MQAAGFRAIVRSQELSVMGFAEILGRLPRIYRAMREIENEIARTRPDAIVFIDYPGFHFRLAKRLKPLGIPIVYYIPPKVWVWKKFRLKAMRALFSKVLCIFPFEEPFFRSAQLPTRFVGNPLVDSLPLKLSQEEARRSLGIGANETVVTLMPGSRPSEIQRHFKFMMLAAFESAKATRKKLRILIPLADSNEEAHLQAELRSLDRNHPDWRESLQPGFVIGKAPVALRASDAGLIKSGTSTLEAALMDCPHAVVYRVSWLTEAIFRAIVRYHGPVGLVNLMLGTLERPKRVTTEILGCHVGVTELATELISLLTDSERVARMRADFASIRAVILMDAKESPSDRVAQEVVETAKRGLGAPGGVS